MNKNSAFIAIFLLFGCSPKVDWNERQRQQRRVRQAEIAREQQIAARKGDNALKNAENWAKDMGFTLVGQSCSPVDSDGDGYFTCSVNIGDKMVSLQCPGVLGGCKLTENKTSAPQGPQHIVVERPLSTYEQIDLGLRGVNAALEIMDGAL